MNSTFSDTVRLKTKRTVYKHCTLIGKFVYQRRRTQQFWNFTSISGLSKYINICQLMRINFLTLREKSYKRAKKWDNEFWCWISKGYHYELMTTCTERKREREEESKRYAAFSIYYIKAYIIINLPCYSWC